MYDFTVFKAMEIVKRLVVIQGLEFGGKGK